VSNEVNWAAVGGIAGAAVFVWRILKSFFSFVTRQDLKDALDGIQGENEKRHHENVERLTSIDTAIARTHQRVDEMYRDFIGKQQR